MKCVAEHSQQNVGIIGYEPLPQLIYLCLDSRVLRLARCQQFVAFHPGCQYGGGLGSLPCGTTENTHPRQRVVRAPPQDCGVVWR
jgi:hypothetical protein